LVQETHLVHHEGNPGEVKLFLHWLDLVLTLISSRVEFLVLDGQQLSSELLLEGLQAEGFTLLQAVALIGFLNVFHLLLQQGVLFRSQDVRVQLIEGGLSWFPSVISLVGVTRFSPAWRSSSERVLLFSLLLLLLNLRLITEALISFFVESIVGFLALAVIHHVDDLQGKVVELWLRSEVLHLLGAVVMHPLQLLVLLLFEETLLISQERVQVSWSVVVRVMTRLVQLWLESAILHFILLLLLFSGPNLSVFHSLEILLALLQAAGSIRIV
jgi:hypothetical protein